MDGYQQPIGAAAIGGRGLNYDEAAKWLYETKRLRPQRRSSWMLLLDQFKSPIMLLLFCSAIMSLTLVEDMTNGVIILVILFVSALLGFWHEWSLCNPN